MNIYIETYGCSANQNNGEIMAGLLSRNGLIIVNNEKIADICILNSCIVKGPTLQKMLSRIKRLSKKKLIVAGCMPDIFSKKILQIAPKASLVGSHHVNEIVRAVKAIMERKQVSLISKQPEIHLCHPKNYKNKVIGITQISEGCLGDCSYCTVKFVKGNLNSYPQEDIIKNIQNDIESGCREIWLTSQDCSAYGLDRPSNKIFLPELLKKILAIKGKFLVRLGMSNPNHILPILKELTEIYKNKKMLKFLHIPLQSGSDKILKGMNRKYDVNEFKKIINSFRKEISGITISTDIIVGFPGETDEDFNKTLSLIKEIKPDVMNISRFWPMPGTRAAEMKLINQKKIMERTDELMKLHNQLSLAINQSFIGKEMKVFVDENREGLIVARDSAYRFVILKGDKSLLGKTVNVKIVGADSHHLIGEITPLPL